MARRRHPGDGGILHRRLQECPDLQPQRGGAADLEHDHQPQPPLGADQPRPSRQWRGRARAGPSPPGLADGGALPVARAARLGSGRASAERRIPQQVVSGFRTGRALGAGAGSASAGRHGEGAAGRRRPAGCADVRAEPGDSPAVYRRRAGAAAPCRDAEDPQGIGGPACAGRADQEFPVSTPVRHHQHGLRLDLRPAAALRRGQGVRPAGRRIRLAGDTVQRLDCLDVRRARRIPSKAAPTTCRSPTSARASSEN